MNSEEKLKILRECSDFSSEEKIERFEDTLFSIKTDKNKDFKILSELFKFFSDESDYYLMFSLVHTIESFPDPGYICCFLKNISRIYANSLYWANILFIRIINDEDSLKYLKKNLDIGDTLVLLQLIQNILNDKHSSQKQKQVVAQLRDQVNKKS